MSKGAFGALSWNSAEDKIAYVAEKKQPKTVSYFTVTKNGLDEKEKPIAVRNHIHLLIIVDLQK